MHRLSFIDVLWVFAIISAAAAVGLPETEQATSLNIAVSPEISVHTEKAEQRTSDTADALLGVDAGAVHENKSGREARQFRTFGFGRPFGYGRPYGFGRPYYGGYGGFGGFGGFGGYGRPFYGGGFGRPYGYYPRPYYPRPYYGGPCCFYG